MFALIARTQQTTMLDGYIEYGAGDFDGQSSGHDFYGVSFSGGFAVACGTQGKKCFSGSAPRTRLWRGGLTGGRLRCAGPAPGVIEE